MLILFIIPIGLILLNELILICYYLNYKNELFYKGLKYYFNDGTILNRFRNFNFITLNLNFINHLEILVLGLIILTFNKKNKILLAILIMLLMCIVVESKLDLYSFKSALQVD
jgi:hypothetical protein